MRPLTITQIKRFTCLKGRTPPRSAAARRVRAVSARADANLLSEATCCNKQLTESLRVLRRHHAPLLSSTSTHLLLQVKALAADARFSALYSLLTIFSAGSLSDYNAFVAAHGDLIASLGIDTERSTETMRLFTLVSLGSASASLDFATVAAALQVAPAEVEGWVVRAVTRGLLEARVDQASGVVTVTRCLTREFGAPQWAALQVKLRAWRENVATLLSTVEGGAAAVRSV